MGSEGVLCYSLLSAAEHPPGTEAFLLEKKLWKLIAICLSFDIRRFFQSSRSSFLKQLRAYYTNWRAGLN